MFNGDKISFETLLSFAFVGKVFKVYKVRKVSKDGGLFLFDSLVFLYRLGSDGSGYFGGVVTCGISGGGGVRAPCFAAYEACDKGKTQEI